MITFWPGQYIDPPPRAKKILPLSDDGLSILPILLTHTQRLGGMIWVDAYGEKA